MCRHSSRLGIRHSVRVRGSANSLAVRFAEVTHRARDADVAAVLEELAWRGTEDEIENIRAPYLRGDGRLFALETVEGVPSLGIRVGDAVTCIGVRWSDEGAELRLVATRGPLRGRGLASQLIVAVVDALQVESVWAETDRDAVEFYRKVGFAVRSLGEKHPGMERFHCTLRLHPEIYKCAREHGRRR